MIALTQENREELISYCSEEIERLRRNLKTYGDRWLGYNETKIHIHQIALASLTAEPVGFISEYTIERDDNNIVVASDFKGIFNAKCNPPESGCIYAIPPVPEINISHELMDLVKAVEFYHTVIAENPDTETGAWKDAYDWIKNAAIEAAPVIKRLNGLED